MLNGSPIEDTGAGEAKPAFRARVTGVFLKPAPPKEPHAKATPDDLSDLEAESRSMSDKERLIGLIAAPWAAGIGILVVSALIGHDPAAHLADGQVNRLHVSVSLYHEVLAALVILAVAMLGLSLWRKRLYLGVVTALYGLTLFNLHYWGFGVPFILCGAWFLVRAWRLQRSIKEAGGGVRSRYAPPLRTATSGVPPKANKRYTPRAARRS